MEGLKYPDMLGEIYYKAPKDNPSYSTEFPHDLNYDPGAISGLYELNYFPSSGGSSLLIILPIGILIFLFAFRKYLNLNKIGTLLWVAGLSIALLGPIRLPSIFRFNTALGLAKGLGLFLLVIAGLKHITNKKDIQLTNTKSFIPIITYIISLLLSVFVMTNPNFFVEDFGIVVTGIIFYYISYILLGRRTNTPLVVGKITYHSMYSRVASLHKCTYRKRNYGNHIPTVRKLCISS